MLYKKVKAQTFFQASRLQQYFIVDVVDSSNNALCVPYKVTNVVSKQLAEQKLIEHAYKEQAQVIDAKVIKTNKTSWFKQIGWLEHFTNCNLIYLAHQTQLPN